MIIHIAYFIILYSADVLIGNDSVVEIKCPYVAKDSTNYIEAINNKKVNRH